METVGIRELKANLSHYIRKVKSGEKIIITDRKKEVAVILPQGQESEYEELLQLIQRGLAHWSGGKPTGMPSRVKSKGKSVSSAVLEGRR